MFAGQTACIRGTGMRQRKAGVRGKTEEAAPLLHGGGLFPSVKCFAFYTMPCAIMALATFMNPATLAPFT